jgi:hypothetical protein
LTKKFSYCAGGGAGDTGDDAGRIVINDFKNQKWVPSDGPKSASAAAQVITFVAMAALGRE